MSSGPTGGACDGRVWSARPARAFLVRLALVVAPIVGSYASARIASPALWHPAGWGGAAAFMAQVAVIGSATALLTERALRRFLPLASLLNMSLVFPDRAPSRFGLALRSGTIKQLEHSAANGLPSDHQAAAETLIAMVTALSRHDRLTRGHTERVRAHAELIGQELGLTEHDREKLQWAAMVHDVGKIGVAPEILNSPDKPTEEQWQVLRQHPVIGGELVEPLADWLGEWRLAASQHHEHWDGTGYPSGLAGDDISLAGRIVAVADAYDVITSKRSYKPAVPAQVARREMVDCAGSQFDPTVVRALITASLEHKRPRFGFVGWFTELGGFSAIPRAVGQAVAVTTTAAALTVGAVASTPLLATPTSVVEATLQTQTPISGGTPDALAYQDPDAPSEPGTDIGSTPVGDDQTAPQESAVAEETTSTSSAPVDEAPPTTIGSTTAATPSSMTTMAPTTDSPATTTTQPTTTTTAATTTSSTTGSWAQDDSVSGGGGNNNLWVLDNDTPPVAFDHQTLTIVAPPTNGTANPHIPGDLVDVRIMYRADWGFVGTDQFSYRICDTGGSCSTATVTITIS